MQNFNGAEIVRVVESGRRVGAVLYQQGKPILLLREDEIKKFGEILRRTGQRLGNAQITSNGRIVPVENKTVQDRDKASYGKAFDAPVKATPVKTAVDKATQAKTAPPTPVKAVSSATTAAARPPQQKPPPLRDSLRCAGFGLHIGATEERLLNIILSGLEMAKHSGVDSAVTGIKKNPAYSGRQSYYLRVDVNSRALSGKYSSILFFAYIDGVIEIDALYKNDDVLSFEHQGDIVYADFSCVGVGGYIGMEVSSTKNRPIGAAEFWSTGSNNKYHSQVICVLLSPDLSCVSAYAQITQEAGTQKHIKIIPLTQEFWQRVTRLFSS